MTSANNSLIAKNTLFLYAQMLFGLIIGLYTGRVVISSLGIVDYGIYNIAGGVVSSLWFIRSALSSASTRYLIYGLGKHDSEKLKNTFGNILFVHFTLALLMFLFLESLGVWFVMNKLVIPKERLSAALWVYQFSVLSFVIAIICAPYNGVIIAHEKMKVFAFIALMDKILKLLIVFLITISPFDRLVFLSFLGFCVSLLNRFFYGWYCSTRFPETHTFFRFDRDQYKEILSYAGWMCIGNIAHMCCREGFNILLNLFYGPVANAARGVAVMVQGNVEPIGSQFQVAMKPQIIKSFAEGDKKHMKMLIFTGAKFSYYITFALALPVMLEIHQFLGWWLEDVPQWTIPFTIVLVAISCVNVVGISLYNAVSATGDMKKYQTAQSVVLILFLPITYILLRVTRISPIVPFIILFFFYCLNFLVGAQVALKQLGILFIDYFKLTLAPIILVSISSSVFPVFLRCIMNDSVWSFLIICGSSVLSVLCVSFFLGCNQIEKRKIMRKIRSTVLQRRTSNG